MRMGKDVQPPTKFGRYLYTRSYRFRTREAYNNNIVIKM